jgi:hypothetical protein
VISIVQFQFQCDADTPMPARSGSPGKSPGPNSPTREIPLSLKRTVQFTGTEWLLRHSSADKVVPMFYKDLFNVAVGGSFLSLEASKLPEKIKMKHKARMPQHINKLVNAIPCRGA